MFTQSNNNLICVNRGDNFTITLPINIGTPVLPTYYDLQEGDYVYVGVMEPNQPFEFALIRKQYDANNQSGSVLYMDFKSTDTEELLPGKYFYTVKLVKANGEVFTLLPKTQFNIID